MLWAWLQSWNSLVYQRAARLKPPEGCNRGWECERGGFKKKYKRPQCGEDGKVKTPRLYCTSGTVAAKFETSRTSLKASLYLFFPPFTTSLQSACMYTCLYIPWILRPLVHPNMHSIHHPMWDLRERETWEVEWWTVSIKLLRLQCVFFSSFSGGRGEIRATAAGKIRESLRKLWIFVYRISLLHLHFQKFTVAIGSRFGEFDYLQWLVFEIFRFILFCPGHGAFAYCTCGHVLFFEYQNFSGLWVHYFWSRICGLSVFQ